MRGRCVWCGDIGQVETIADLHDHLDSDGHRALVQLQRDLDAAVYLPREMGG